MAELCRPETVTVDGEEVTVVVRGDQPMGDTDRAALAELVAAVQRKVRADREFYAQPCKEGEHQPACDGYYPPGLDTYRCLCPCHQEGR